MDPTMAQVLRATQQAQQDQPPTSQGGYYDGQITVPGGAGNPVMEAQRLRVQELMKQGLFKTERDAYDYVQSGKDAEYEKKYRASVGRPSYVPSPLRDLEGK